MWSRPRCEHIIKKGNRKVICESNDAEPQFTKALKNKLPKERQPRFFCEAHAPLYRRVSPITGQKLPRRLEWAKVLAMPKKSKPKKRKVEEVRNLPVSA